MHKGFFRICPGILLLLFVAAFALGAGCLSDTAAKDTSAGELHSHYEYADSWSPGLGCYSHVDGYVYNAGNTTIPDVRLNFNMVNSKTNTIRDSRLVYIGQVAPGETRSYETILDGECTQDYRVEPAFL